MGTSGIAGYREPFLYHGQTAPCSSSEDEWPRREEGSVASVGEPSPNRSISRKREPSTDRSAGSALKLGTVLAGTTPGAGKTIMVVECPFRPRVPSGRMRAESRRGHRLRSL